METFDVIVVGGGPAGSSCARTLVRGGARVAVVDRATFPRVKLCAGWISAPIWDVLGLAPREYPAGLWPWQTCHVHFRGRAHTVSCKGWFIRRVELDDFLLRTSGASVHTGVAVKNVERDADGFWQVGALRARHLVGAAGTHCPIARMLAPPRPMGPVGVQELELPLAPDAIARTRIGDNGEPELLLHDDLRGYAWNIPKTDWLNVGVGTLDPGEVRAAWTEARAHFDRLGHLPAEAATPLEHVKGHSYYLFHPDHLDGAARADADGKGGVYLAGDALGLAQPLTAEGILPATLSGRLIGEAILAGAPASYPARLRAHPVLDDYRRVYRARHAVSKLRRGNSNADGHGVGNGNGNGDSNGDGHAKHGESRLARYAGSAVATGFAWMFSGARVPAPRLVDLALSAVERSRS
ncbi:MAG TPA: NAD(P)/FAD-dependent oxidoreductase [Kofleriaceae bacterium]|nr:NAD(P)/FAD-dependent oxidoreductase [Kofleriaceae bacterium]